MSLLACRHRCAGHGQCALGPWTQSVRIACARRWGVGGDRAAAGSRYRSREPAGSAPRRVAAEGTGARPQARGGLGFRSSEPRVKRSEPLLYPEAGRYCRLFPVPSRSRAVSGVPPPPKKKLPSKSNPSKNLISCSSPPSCLLPRLRPSHLLSISFAAAARGWGRCLGDVTGGFC